MLTKGRRSLLIVGFSPCAEHIVRDLSVMGGDVVLAAPDPLNDLQPVVDILGSERVLANARLLDLDGAAGDFTVHIRAGDKTMHLQSEAIVLAEKDIRQPKFYEYGLSPAPSVISLSELGALLAGNARDAAALEEFRHLVFLNGLATESHPVIAGEIMHRSILLQENYNIQTYILTRNLKVAADGLEVLYRQSKAAGTIYVKFEDSGPEIHQERSGRVTFTFDDDLTGLPLSLAPDVVVVDEDIRPSHTAIELGRRLAIESDSNGFLQGDNVHRLTVKTNRKGIFVAGSARMIASEKDQRVDGGNVAIALGGFSGSIFETDDRAVIDRWQCVRCLTCYRLCPHGAIQVKDRVTVMPEACERCGICTAECPRHAITMPGVDAKDVMPRISMELPRHGFTPTIIAFCCSRSAVSAAELARCMGRRLPERLTVLELPCAGSLSLNHFFTAFQHGADGVLALTCHKDNCHSSDGNQYAQQRVDQLSEVFQQAGFALERLCCHSLASNMGREFADMLEGFETRLRELGPSHLAGKGLYNITTSGNHWDDAENPVPGEDTPWDLRIEWK